jgi:hypothetical protein
MANNNIQEQILAGDKTILDVFGEKSKDFDDIVSSGKNIFGQETAPLSQVELLEMIMPFAGSIRGGKQAVSSLDQLLNLSKKLGIRITPKRSKYQLSISDINDINKISKAKIQSQKALDKYKIADPDKTEFLDAISALLTRSRN